MSRLDMDPRGRPPHVPPASRRRGWFGTAAKAVSAALAVAVLAWGVRYGGDYLNPPAPPPGPVPVIGPDAGPVKVIPDNPGGVTVPDQDKVILNGDTAQPKVEQLLPPPETPLASPGVQPAAPPPAPQPVAQQPPAPPPQAASPPEVPPQSASPPPTQTSSAPAVTSISPRPSPAPAIVPPPPPKPAMTAAAPPPAQAAAALPPGKGYFLQLGSVRSAEDAQASWTRLKTAQPDILAPLPANAVKVDLGPDRGVFYRIMAGPITDEASAARSCNTLKQRNVACILVKP